jgi:hypothetical protein
MASVEYGVGGVKGGLEDHASLGSALAVVLAVVALPFALVPVIETGGGSATETRRPGRGLELTRTLPFWPTRKP